MAAPTDFRSRALTSLPVTYYDVTSVPGIGVGDESRFAYESTPIQQGEGGRAYGACIRGYGDGAPLLRQRPPPFLVRGAPSPFLVRGAPFLSIHNSSVFWLVENHPLD